MKRFFSLFLCLTVFLTVCSFSETAYSQGKDNFSDTIGHWAESSIAEWSGMGILQGYEGKFRPDESITRAEMAVVINKIMKYESVAELPYKDIKEGNFYTESVLKVASSGVMVGDYEYFRPNDLVTKQEAAVLFANVFHISEYDNCSFADKNNIADWAVPYVAGMEKKGYIKGNNGYFNPQSNITRAEIVTILDKIVANIYQLNGIYNNSELSNVSGDIVINSDDVTLENQKIDGDLIISEGVGNGDVNLNNLLITGTLYVHGGGENSVHVNASNINSVIINKQNGPVRVLSDNDSVINNITVNSKSKLEGKYDNIIINSEDDISFEGDAEKVIVNSSAEIQLFKGTIASLEVPEMEDEANITINKEAILDNVNLLGKTNLNVNGDIKTINISEQANGSKVIGEGKVENAYVNAKTVFISTPETKIEYNESVNKNSDIKNTENNKKTSSKGSNSGSSSGGGNHSSGGNHSNGGNSGNGNSGGDSSDGNGSGNNSDTTVKPAKIISVESVTNGLVRLTLDQRTESALGKEAFSIICTGAGRDMTILSVSTKDNRTYEIITAYYNDNTYNIEVTLSDGTRLNKDFESKYDCPSINVQKLERIDNETAEFSFVSDTPGTFYYGLHKIEPYSASINSKYIGLADLFTKEPTAEELMKFGNSVEMNLKLNSLNITGLEKDTEYIIYYVAKGVDDKVTPVKSLEITNEIQIEPNPPTPDNPDDETENISIVSVEGFYKYKGDFDENYWYEIKLNKVTDNTLSLDNVVIKCSRGPLTLGRLSTADNQNYIAYMKPGYIPFSDNTYTCVITLNDGTIITKEFFFDVAAPVVLRKEIERTSSTSIKVSFKVDEPGKVYYKILDYVEQDTSVKDPTDIFNTGKSESMTYGTNIISMEILDTDTDKWFCFAPEDELGNRVVNFMYMKIPAYVEQEKPDDNQNPVILNIEPQIKDGKAAILVTFDKEINISTIANEFTDITNLPGRAGYRTEIIDGQLTGTPIYITIYNGITIPTGKHTLILYLYMGNNKYEKITADFIVEE